MRGALHYLGTRSMSIGRAFMDYNAWSSVWKTDCFVAAYSLITETSGLVYILTRKCPLPLLDEMATCGCRHRSEERVSTRDTSTTALLCLVACATLRYCWSPRVTWLSGGPRGIPAQGTPVVLLQCVNRVCQRLVVGCDGAPERPTSGDRRPRGRRARLWCRRACAGTSDVARAGTRLFFLLPITAHSPGRPGAGRS